MSIEAITQAVSQYQIGQQQQQAQPRNDVGDFGDRLDKAIGKVNTAQQDSDELLSQLASGENVDLHNTMISLQKADITMRTLVSVRDKVVGAYEQIMNMAI
ncbi:MAG: flagellar hook-basal body complex protein FliE [Myxococcota bacterium]|nr:flagellar hook-basal body complex protein FliE [Myxococcota bacterium]